eukprot:TRINITY_DN3650_c0_g1_i2.p1 TRINITY_DN3650_c0_g1~~TRINITY_DN3650_c0_g1_i2.p1  ORF type:complete len:598 (-),score=132.49 TRINITY_DN3650_c0_g1_i2:59-1852(-)
MRFSLFLALLCASSFAASEPILYSPLIDIDWSRNSPYRYAQIWEFYNGGYNSVGDKDTTKNYGITMMTDQDKCFSVTTAYLSQNNPVPNQKFVMEVDETSIWNFKNGVVHLSSSVHSSHDVTLTFYDGNDGEGNELQVFNLKAPLSYEYFSWNGTTPTKSIKFETRKYALFSSFIIRFALPDQPSSEPTSEPTTLLPSTTLEPTSVTTEPPTQDDTTSPPVETFAPITSESPTTEIIPTTSNPTTTQAPTTQALTTQMPTTQTPTMTEDPLPPASRLHYKITFEELSDGADVSDFYSFVGVYFEGAVVATDASGSKFIISPSNIIRITIPRGFHKMAYSASSYSPFDTVAAESISGVSGAYQLTGSFIYIGYNEGTDGQWQDKSVDFGDSVNYVFLINPARHFDSFDIYFYFPPPPSPPSTFFELLTDETSAPFPSQSASATRRSYNSISAVLSVEGNLTSDQAKVGLEQVERSLLSDQFRIEDRRFIFDSVSYTQQKKRMDYSKIHFYINEEESGPSLARQLQDLIELHPEKLELIGLSSPKLEVSNGSEEESTVPIPESIISEEAASSRLNLSSEGNLIRVTASLIWIQFLIFLF